MPEPDLDNGYVQVYTGNGKGKTTASLGLALRAAGAGLHVFIAQFVKGMEYSEIKALERFSDLITIRQYGRGCFIRNTPTEADIQAARAGLDEVWRIMHSGAYQLIILDEANIATHYGLLAVQDLLDLIAGKPAAMELVITGRYADPQVIARADLVTEMQEIKHYFTLGIQARTGIEK